MTNQEIKNSIERTKEKVRLDGIKSRGESIKSGHYWKDLCLNDLPDEEWSGIEGFEASHQISTYGRVKSLVRKGMRVERILRQNKIICHGDKNEYYLIVSLIVDCNYTHKLVHVLVAETFIPNPENLPQVNHKKGIKTDNRVTELEWNTRTDNMLHSYKQLKRKGVSGEKHGKTTLTESQVIDILKKYVPGMGVKMGKEYGVSKATILKIAKKQTWKNLLQEITPAP